MSKADEPIEVAIYLDEENNVEIVKVEGQPSLDVLVFNAEEEMIQRFQSLTTGGNDGS